MPKKTRGRKQGNKTSLRYKALYLFFFFFPYDMHETIPEPENGLFNDCGRKQIQKSEQNPTDNSKGQYFGPSSK